MKFKNCRAFTLMELLLVLAIIAIASAIVIPRISSNSHNFQAQVRELSAVLKYNRRMAIVSSQLQQAKLFPYKEDSLPKKLKKGHWQSQGADLIWLSSPAGEIHNQVVSIDFFPQGGATGGELLLSQDQFKVKISIDGFTGKVVVDELDDE